MFPKDSRGLYRFGRLCEEFHVLYVSELLNVLLMHFDWTTYRLFECWIMYKLIAWLHLHGSIMIFMSLTEKLDFKMWYVWSLISYLSRLICSLQHLTCQSWMAFILFINFFKKPWELGISCLPFLENRYSLDASSIFFCFSKYIAWIVLMYHSLPFNIQVEKVQYH